MSGSPDTLITPRSPGVVCSIHAAFLLGNACDVGWFVQPGGFVLFWYGLCNRDDVGSSAKPAKSKEQGRGLSLRNQPWRYFSESTPSTATTPQKSPSRDDAQKCSSLAWKVLQLYSSNLCMCKTRNKDSKRARAAQQNPKTTNTNKKPPIPRKPQDRRFPGTESVLSGPGSPQAKSSLICRRFGVLEGNLEIDGGGQSA